MAGCKGKRRLKSYYYLWECWRGREDSNLHVSGLRFQLVRSQSLYGRRFLAEDTGIEPAPDQGWQQLSKLLLTIQTTFLCVWYRRWDSNPHLFGSRPNTSTNWVTTALIQWMTQYGGDGLRTPIPHYPSE